MLEDTETGMLLLVDLNLKLHYYFKSFSHFEQWTPSGTGFVITNLKSTLNRGNINNNNSYKRYHTYPESFVVGGDFCSL